MQRDWHQSRSSITSWGLEVSPWSNPKLDVLDIWVNLICDVHVYTMCPPVKRKQPRGTVLVASGLGDCLTVYLAGFFQVTSFLPGLLNRGESITWNVASRDCSMFHIRVSFFWSANCDFNAFRRRYLYLTDSWGRIEAKPSQQLSDCVYSLQDKDTSLHKKTWNESFSGFYQCARLRMRKFGRLDVRMFGHRTHSHVAS